MDFAETKGRSTNQSLELICPDILTPAELADYCEANVRTVDSWLKQDITIVRGAKHQKKIGQLASVVAFLNDQLSFEAEEVRDFLVTPHIDLDKLEQRTMIDLLKEPDGIPLIVSYAVEQSIT